MKNLIKYSSAILISFLGFISCKEEMPTNFNLASNEDILIPSTAKEVKNSSVRISSETDYNIEAEEFALLLATSLKDKEFRKFLKTEANKKFDGDFDILVSNVKYTQIGNDIFSEKIKKNSPNGYAKGQDIFEKAIKNVRLNISIPVLIEKWDDNKEIPLVVNSVGIIEGETKKLVAYDYLGKKYTIDAIKEPNLPVIVVGENERVNEFGKLYKDQVRNTQNLSTYFSNAKIACTQPYRQDSKWEILKAMFITEGALDQVEGWSLGAPEIRVECWAPVNTTNFSTLTKIGGPGYYFEPSKRADIRDKWWTLPYQEPLFPWIRSVNTRSVIFFFWEWDGNSGSQSVVISDVFKVPSQNGGPETSTTITITTTIPSSGKEITKPVIDQDICPVEFNGSWGVYGGSFKWAVTQQ